MKAYKDIIKLWNDLKVFLWSENWQKANETIYKINSYKKTHRIAYVLAYILH